jgi:ribosomal protein S12 methylthiotransferase
MLVGNPADWVLEAANPRVLSTPTGSAYVKIAEGCNRTCSFCVIPALRGLQRSRPVEDIVREVERLVASGVREVNLVSQDTIAYGRDRPKEEAADLTRVARAVADVPGIHWVRLHYLYPETMPDALVELIADHPHIVKYIDMPLQHAADGMLRRMRRGHGGDRLRRVVTRLKERIPGLTFRTAFIVGHPGETDEEFAELCAFVEWADFDRVGVFRYSDEDSCQSFAMDGKVPARLAANRHRRLMAIQRRIAHKKNAALVGQELEVLVEGTSDEHEYVLMGRHAGQAPDIDGQVYLSGGEARSGEMRRVRITQASDYDLVGELLGEMSEAAEASPPRRVGLRVLQTDGRSGQPG